MARKLPSFQFYPGDWLKDSALSRCSLAARGMWIELICRGFDMPRRGVFRRQNGAALSITVLLSMVPNGRKCHLQQLVDEDVLKIGKRTQTFYIKRLILDELDRRRHIRRQKRYKGDGRMTAKRRLSSSSSSSSTSVSSLEKNQRGILFPPILDTDKFKSAWSDLIAYRRESKFRCWQARTVTKQLTQLEAMGHDRAIDAIEQTIRNGWQGVFEPTAGGQRPASSAAGQRRAKSTAADRGEYPETFKIPILNA